MLQPHYFFALSLPSEMKEEIVELTAPLKEEDPLRKWVHPEDYHITLAFLGQSSGEGLSNAITLVEQSIKTIGCFTLSLSGFGTFGNREAPRIFWMGVQPSPRLHQIREKVFEASEEAGFQLDQKPFSPHITIGRKWKGPSSFSKEWLSGFNPENTRLHQIKEVVLYQTHMDRTPKYEAIHTIQMKDMP
ncbi:RNA 2',3'-cyclic phosphodiesterase [Rossellomorea aquimaris]|uniref:RNA 2',3'-cyclic phosphodiesterase n=1 Tax=Rossellomorea aquimaris TaxID=189382 RepID=UPI001CD1DFB2|nr:RNA 2',3'-cyclic phosphodiesterase [Rossellomorea aquimaris]MCA1056845.1 RNA 2',3'-cyclic phosphodiesterase [Rossellomorea aquimaris]